MPKPNILYLHSHDTGRYVQPYGHAVQTPNIQGLANEGVLFRNAFCAAPTCSPSRASLVTGQSAHGSGMLGLAHRGFSLTDCRQHMVHTLRRAGYTSTLAGVQHVAKDSADIGYDEIVKTDGNSVRQVAPAAADFLRSGLKEPFFFSVGFGETHRQFPPPEACEEYYAFPPRPIPETSETRLDMVSFNASARILDRGVGSVLEALDGAGLGENTLVICTTDHGIAFPRMKCNLTDGGIAVMLIVRGPGGFRGGRAIDSLVSHIDIFPTLCELAGAPCPPWVEGHSLLPIIRGEVAEVNEEIFAEVTYHAAYEPMRAVRTSRWKYIRRFGTRTKPVLANCDDGPSKDVWIRHGWADRDLPSEELYDLIFDPNESSNLALDPNHEHVLGRMRDRLRTWMQHTRDPLGSGPVPAPRGAVITDQDAVSPRGPKRVIQ